MGGVGRLVSFSGKRGVSRGRGQAVRVAGAATRRVPICSLGEAAPPSRAPGPSHPGFKSAVRGCQGRQGLRRRDRVREGHAFLGATCTLSAGQRLPAQGVLLVVRGVRAVPRALPGRSARRGGGHEGALRTRAGRRPGVCLRRQRLLQREGGNFTRRHSAAWQRHRGAVLPPRLRPAGFGGLLREATALPEIRPSGGTAAASYGGREHGGAAEANGQTAETRRCGTRRIRAPRKPRYAPEERPGQGAEGCPLGTVAR